MKTGNPKQGPAPTQEPAPTPPVPQIKNPIKPAEFSINPGDSGWIFCVVLIPWQGGGTGQLITAHFYHAAPTIEEARGVVVEQALSQNPRCAIAQIVGFKITAQREAMDTEERAEFEKHAREAIYKLNFVAEALDIDPGAPDKEWLEKLRPSIRNPDKLTLLHDIAASAERIRREFAIPKK